MVKYFLFGELVDALVGAFALYMSGAAEGEFTYEQVGKVYDLVESGDAFRAAVEGQTAQLFDLVDTEDDTETLMLEEIVIKFAHAVNAESTQNWLDLTADEASLLSRLAAGIIDGDQGGPLF